MWTKTPTPGLNVHKETMASSSSEVIDTTKPTFNLSLHKSTTNRLDYLYEISQVPEDSKIPITDFPIVNTHTMFDKPQVSFKKSIKKLLGGKKEKHFQEEKMEVSQKEVV